MSSPVVEADLQPPLMDSEIERALRAILEHGQVTEVRALQDILWRRGGRERYFYLCPA